MTMRKLLTCLIVAVSVIGCSATERTARNSTEIASLARSSETRFNDIGNEAASESPDLNSIQANAGAGAKEQKQIQTKANQINADVPKMTNVVPWWATLLGRLALASGLIAVLLLLLLTPLGRGVSALVGNALSFVSSLLPTKSVKTGELLAKMDDPKDSMTKQEAVAAIRASDPVLDKAYQRKRSKLKTKDKT